MSLITSTIGLNFDLKYDDKKFDFDPEPSRRPHILGKQERKKEETKLQFRNFWPTIKNYE